MTAFRIKKPPDGAHKRIIYNDVMIGHFVETEGAPFIELYYVCIEGELYYVDEKTDKQYKTICFCLESEILRNAIDMYFHNCLEWCKANGAK